MRTLAVNLGNTTLLGALYKDSKVQRRFRQPRAEGLAHFCEHLAAVLPKSGVDQIVLCSVVPKATPLVAKALKKLCGCTPQLLTGDAKHGLRIAYPDPSRLGADRLAAVLGAQAHLPRKNVIVIDCGTASTVTALHRDGVLCGGAIFPGLGLWAEVLSSRTAQLPPIIPHYPKQATGNSPETAIGSGLYHGHLGALQHLSQTIAAENFASDPYEVITTGGNAKLFCREKLFTRIAPDLILDGLLAFASNIQNDA